MKNYQIKTIKIDKKITFKTRSIDLHGYTLEEANKSLRILLLNLIKKK